MVYETTSRTSRPGPSWRLKSLGEGPALLEAISGELQMRSSHAPEFQSWLLDVKGKRRQHVSVTVESGDLVLKLLPGHKAVYYEIAVD